MQNIYIIIIIYTIYTVFAMAVFVLLLLIYANLNNKKIIVSRRNESHSGF